MAFIHPRLFSVSHHQFVLWVRGGLDPLVVWSTYVWLHVSSLVVCVCVEILLVNPFKSTVLALLMRTKGVLWDKCWQRRTLAACSRAVCSLIPLISIRWHSTRLVLRLCWSINLFFSVLALEAN